MKRLAFLLSVFFVAFASAADLGKIQRIDVLGNEKVEAEAILSTIRLAVGDYLREEEVAQAIKDIWKLHYFKDIRVEREEVDGGVVVTIRVQEKAAIREVVLEGNKKVTTDDIKEVMSLKPYSILDEGKVAANARRVEDLYLEKGFFLAEVDPVTEGASNNEVTVRFKIREGKKVLVKEINIVGNEALTDEFLKARLQTKGAGIIPGITSTGTYQQSALETDREIIEYLYSSKGYVDATVGEAEVMLSPDKRWVYVTLRVEEGKQYRVGAVEWSGDADLLTPKELAKLVKTKPGQIYNRIQVGEDIQRLTDRFGDDGYAFANVVPIPKQDKERLVVDLTYDMQKGNLVHLEDVSITGNLGTWDKTIRREVALIEGELFRNRGVEETRRRLERLGYFETVKITTPRGSAADTLDLAIDVTEKPTGTFSLGAGFSSVESFVFTANVSRSNFLGLGLTMGLNANLSLGKNLKERGFFNGENSQQQIQFDIFDPYFLDTRWTASLSIFSVNRTYALSEYSRGLNVSLGHYLLKGDDLDFSVRYALETVGLTSLRPTQRQAYGGQLYRSGTKSSLTASITLDKRDNRLAATEGLFMTAAAEWAGGFRVNDEKVVSVLGGDFRFLRAQFNLRAFYPILKPLTREVVLRYNFSLGSIWSLDGSLVPYTERYRSGGINSIRGFAPLTLGPQIRYLVNGDPVHSARNLPVGGTLSVVNNLEIEFPVIPPAQVRGVIFLDAGNAFGGLYGNEAFRFSGIRWSAGFGIRWRSPMGPLRFEWGFPLDRKPGERPQVFEFTIGSFF